MLARKPALAGGQVAPQKLFTSVPVTTILVLKMLGSSAAVLSRCSSSVATLTRPTYHTSAASTPRILYSSTALRGRMTSLSAFAASNIPSLSRRYRGQHVCRGATTTRCLRTSAEISKWHQNKGVLSPFRQWSAVRGRIDGAPPSVMFTTDSRDVGEERRADGPVIQDEAFWADTTVTTDEDVWSRKGSGGSGGEAFGLLMEEKGERDTWMEGLDVDPEAEAIFFGDKIPFPDLGLSPTLCDHLETLDLAHSTAVQAAAIPRVLAGKDVIIGAETGSGKTIAYLLPIVERLLRGEAVANDLPDELLGNARGWSMFPDVVVLVPNKELCEQVLSVLKGILRALEADVTGGGNTCDITAAAMYGSSYEYPYSPNRPAPSILVCTPSFLHKYANMKVIPLFCKATTLVLDEADMLMEGSYKSQLDDILVSFRRADKMQAKISLPGFEKTQYVLAAATLPTYGLKSVDQYIKRAFPSAHKIQQVHMHKHHPAIQQVFIEVGKDVSDKIEAVMDLLQGIDTEKNRTMVFANTAATCKLAYEALAKEGFSVVPYHKEVPPLERLENLKALRSGRAKVLVCTDLAARGIDVPSVTRIIQMEMATNVVHHLHRLGRAARAGRTGRATSFFDTTTKDLVNSIKDAEGSRLDGSFSRQRGFRNKFKKYGPSRTFQGETYQRKKGRL